MSSDPYASAPYYQLQHAANEPPNVNDSDAGGRVEQNNAAADADSSQQHDQHGRPTGGPSAGLAGMMGSFPYMPSQQHFAGSGVMSAAATPYGPSAYAAHAAPMNSAKQRDRTKVSRACDECRRKKIRCDAVDETGDPPCNNCLRSGSRCAFSRQPMKRGPSKGYIKELSERLHTLESQVQHSPMQPQVLQDLQQMRQTMAEHGARRYSGGETVVSDPRAGEKRTHSVAEAPQNGSPQQIPLAPMHSPVYAQIPAPQQQQQLGHAQPPFWRHHAPDNLQDSGGLPHYIEPDSAKAETSFDWDEDVIDEYYRIIHQTFPLLPTNKNRLRQRLADCPASLREAFLAAIDCLMRTFPTTSLAPNPGYPQAVKRAGELLARYPFDNPSSHNNTTHLIYLQTLLLMALECDNHGPATIRGQAGPSRAEWLGRAAGVAGHLEINVTRSSSTSVVTGDRDSEDKLARRVWWVLFILDRWHASSTADLLKLPENSVVLLPQDQILLGESTYHLARLSFIIGHLAAILTTTKTPSTDVMAPLNPASSLLGLTLAGEIDRFRESVESVWGSFNLVHLSYHHCHLLIKRLDPTTEPTALVAHAVRVATVLNSRDTPVTPLNHHFAALAAMTLCELCDVPKTRAEATRGLDQMIECLGAGVGLAGRQESEGWDGAIRELVVQKKARMQGAAGLTGLADAAVASTDGAAAAFEPTRLTRYGYLTALGQGTFKSA